MSRSWSEYLAAQEREEKPMSNVLKFRKRHRKILLVSHTEAEIEGMVADMRREAGAR